MPIHRYSTAASHVLLAGTGIYCVVRYTKYTRDYYNLPMVTFGVIIMHSLFGVWRWGNPDYGEKVKSVFEFTLYLREALALSCMSAHMCLKAGFNKYLAYAHPIVSLIPLLEFVEKDVDDELVDFLVAVNVISCGIFSYLNDQNYWGSVSALSYLIARFSRFTDREVPDEDLRNFALCFFTYFAYRAYSGILARV